MTLLSEMTPEQQTAMACLIYEHNTRTREARQEHARACVYAMNHDEYVAREAQLKFEQATAASRSQYVHEFDMLTGARS